MTSHIDAILKQNILKMLCNIHIFFMWQGFYLFYIFLHWICWLFPSTYFCSKHFPWIIIIFLLHKPCNGKLMKSLENNICLSRHDLFETGVLALATLWLAVSSAITTKLIHISINWVSSKKYLQVKCYISIILSELLEVSAPLSMNCIHSG